MPLAVPIEYLLGDITRVPVDAIVNAANAALAGGGGVDGAIHRAARPALMRELDEVRQRVGSCPTGSAVVTGAGKLPARYVFHAVGPIYRGGQSGEESLLASCYTTCLDLARERHVQSISFPSISTGVYGYPAEAAARVAIDAIREWLRNAENTQPELALRSIKLIQFSEEAHAIYARLLDA